MRDDEEDEAPRAPRGPNKDNNKKKAPRKHRHIGPNVRAFQAGLAFCSSCDADKILRLTDAERESERAAKDRLEAARKR